MSFVIFLDGQKFWRHMLMYDNCSYYSPLICEFPRKQ